MRTIFKNHVFLTALLLAATLSHSQTSKQPVDYLNAPGPIQFNKGFYVLTWSSHPAANFYKQEYVAKGDAVTKFKTMILLDLVTGKANIKDVVSAKVEELKKMKTTNPVVNYNVFDNAKKGEYMLDFLVSQNSPDGKSIEILERNVYRYKVYVGKAGQSGVLLFGVSVRSYGSEADKFLAALKGTKGELINEVASYKIPEVAVKQ